MNPAEYADWKKARVKVYIHRPCCRCKRTEPDVTFAKKSTRCTDCNNEAQRISRVRTGKRPPTMIG